MQQTKCIVDFLYVVFLILNLSQRIDLIVHLFCICYIEKQDLISKGAPQRLVFLYLSSTLFINYFRPDPRHTTITGFVDFTYHQ